MILPLFIFSLFGYTTYTAIENTDPETGVLDAEVFVEAVKTDIKDAKEWYLSGESANHNNYND